MRRLSSDDAERSSRPRVGLRPLAPLAPAGVWPTLRRGGRAAMSESGRELRIKLAEEQDKALARAVVAYRTLRAAQLEYEHTMLEASDAGVSATRIARAIGLTETAVRLFIKRRRARTG